jgi:hypothetical protein
MSNFALSGKFEQESRTSHIHIIHDEEVRKYIKDCTIPAKPENVKLNESLIHPIPYPDSKSIDFYIAVDGESTTISVNEGFPSSLLTFFQFGYLAIAGSDLDDLDKKPFISPDDIKKLKKIRREKFVMPVKNVALKNGTDFRTVVRTAIQDFFRKDPEKEDPEEDGKEDLKEDAIKEAKVKIKEDAREEPLLATVYWFIFEMYDPNSVKHDYILSRCPHCGTAKIVLRKDSISKDYSWECTEPKCKKEIYITDVFRLFERVDDEVGAEGIVAHLKNVIETFFIIHAIKRILERKKGSINRFLIVKDGPLSFGGDTGNMVQPMQAMLRFLTKTYNINLVGVESSGPFVDHAKQISEKIPAGHAFLLNNKHIYTYILVGDPEAQDYGASNYYGGKMIYKSIDKRIYVLTMPVNNHVTYYKQPELLDFKNIQEVLFSVARLRCDIYENALIPIAVINKMISISTRSGGNILKNFLDNYLNNEDRKDK